MKWDLVELGDVVSFLDHKRVPVKESERKEGIYPYYGANGQQGTIDGFIFDEPLVLLAEDGGHFFEPQRGIAYKIVGKTWVNNHAHVLKPNSEYIDINYLCAVLTNLNVEKFLTGSTRAKLTKTGAKKIKIPLPPLSEQQRIADILDRADVLREQRKQAIALLDDLLQSTFLEMFGDPVSNPMDWDRKTIGDLTDVLTGATPSRKINKFYDGEIPWVKTTEVNGTDIYQTEEYISQSAIKESNCKLVPVNSVILAMYGQGKTRGQVSRLKVPAATNQACAVILPTTNIHSDYLYYFLLFSYAQLRALGRGGNQPNLNLALVRSFLINCPPLEKQNQFAQIVEKIEAQKALQNAHLEQLNHLFGCLQQRAFSGEL